MYVHTNTIKLTETTLLTKKYLHDVATTVRDVVLLCLVCVYVDTPIDRPTDRLTD